MNNAKTPASNSSRSSAILNLAAAATLMGAAVGLVAAVVAVLPQRHVEHRTWFLFVRDAVRNVEGGVIVVVLGALAIATALASARAATRGIVSTPRFERVVMTTLSATLLAAVFLIQANRYWLPHKFSPVSLAADAGILFFVMVVARWLLRLRWEALLARASAPRWRRPALVAVIAIAAVHLGAWVVRSARPASGPPVILIVVDTLRADHLGAYGHTEPVSPNIDRLARDSVLYENAIAPAPWTAPSVASMMTARTPPTLRFLGEHPVPVADRFLTLAELFRDRGYRTQAIVSHHFVSSVLGFDQGFDGYDESQAQGHGYVSSREVSDRALEFLARQDDRPFFLFLHYFDPHFDFILHEGYEFGPEYEGPVRSGQSFHELVALAKTMEPRDIERVRALYDSEIAFTDAHIGRVLERLRESGLYDKSLIVFTADHGEEFLDRGNGFIGHTRTLYGELINVPLLVKRPGARSAETVADYVSLTDLMPLVAGEAGQPLPRSVEHGEGGAATFDGGRRPIVSETRRVARLQSVIDDGFKLIQDLDSGERQLYDLRRDPGERDDLIERSPGDAERLSTLLAGYRDWTRAATPIGTPSPEAEFTEQQREQIRSLGYVD